MTAFTFNPMLLWVGWGGVWGGWVLNCHCIEHVIDNKQDLSKEAGIIWTFTFTVVHYFWYFILLGS